MKLTRMKRKQISMVVTLVVMSQAAWSNTPVDGALLLDESVEGRSGDGSRMEPFVPTPIDLTPQDVEIRNETLGVLGDLGEGMEQMLVILKEAQGDLELCERTHGSRHTHAVREAYRDCQLTVIENELLGYRQLQETAGYTKGQLESFLRRTDRSVEALQSLKRQETHKLEELDTLEQQMQGERERIRAELQAKVSAGEELELTSAEQKRMNRVVRQFRRIAHKRANYASRQAYLEETIAGVNRGREMLSGLVDGVDYMHFDLGLTIEDLGEESEFVREEARLSASLREMGAIHRKMVDMGPLFEGLLRWSKSPPRVMPAGVGRLDTVDPVSIVPQGQRELIDFFLGEEKGPRAATREEAGSTPGTESTGVDESGKKPDQEERG